MRAGILPVIDGSCLCDIHPLIFITSVCSTPACPFPAVCPLLHRKIPHPEDPDGQPNMIRRPQCDLLPGEIGSDQADSKLSSCDVSFCFRAVRHLSQKQSLCHSGERRPVGRHSCRADCQFPSRIVQCLLHLKLNLHDAEEKESTHKKACQNRHHDCRFQRKYRRQTEALRCPFSRDIF